VVVGPGCIKDRLSVITIISCIFIFHCLRNHLFNLNSWSTICCLSLFVASLQDLRCAFSPLPYSDKTTSQWSITFMIKILHFHIGFLSNMCIYGWKIFIGMNSGVLGIVLPFDAILSSCTKLIRKLNLRLCSKIQETRVEL
jgi:hypothetical protein